MEAMALRLYKQWVCVLKDFDPMPNAERFIEILQQAKKNYRKVLADAGNVGTQVHNAIQTYLATGHEPVAPSDQVTSAFLAFLEWKDAHEVKPLQIKSESKMGLEYTLYDEELGVAGTADFIGYIDGELTVADWKSSKGIYPSHRHQVAAYFRMATSSPAPELRGKMERTLILRLDKETGMPEPKDTTDTLETDVDIYKALAIAYSLMNPIK